MTDGEGSDEHGDAVERDEGFDRRGSGGGDQTGPSESEGDGDRRPDSPAERVDGPDDGSSDPGEARPEFGWSTARWPGAPDESTIWSRQPDDGSGVWRAPPTTEDPARRRLTPWRDPQAEFEYVAEIVGHVRELVWAGDTATMHDRLTDLESAATAVLDDPLADRIRFGCDRVRANTGPESDVALEYLRAMERLLANERP